jgi:hypothetical protein
VLDDGESGSLAEDAAVVLGDPSIDSGLPFTTKERVLRGIILAKGRNQIKEIACRKNNSQSVSDSIKNRNTIHVAMNH